MRIFICCSVLLVFNHFDISLYNSHWLGVGIIIGIVWAIGQDIRELMGNK